MSWLSNVRVLGVCGLWLALQVGCGSNPSVGGGVDEPQGGSSGTGGKANGGTAGSFVIPIGGDTGEAGSGEEPPTNYICGNRELEPGEFCDDGNTKDGDGCSADCKELDLDYDCSAIGEPCVKVVICGNSVLEGDEACDDGNEDDEDGCSADCSTIEDGFGCIRPGEACVKLSVCGNGVRERGEQCDDGHAPEGGDGCDAQCQIEPDYLCPITGEYCVKEVCGDGVRTKNEECDNTNTAGCVNCVVQPGWHCNTTSCKPECGDGLVVGSEECDDGGATGGDGCSGGCKVEPFFKCSMTTPSMCTPDTQCGNGKLDPIFTGNVVTGWERCDPPNVDGCNATCTNFTPETADPPVCGNEVVEVGEDCDKPAADPGCSATCKVETGYSCPPVGACTLIPRCGDNTVNFALGEACDPPQVGQGCSATCKVESGWVCTGLTNSVCVKPVCGNGVVESGEQCDDGSAGGTQDGCFGCVINPDYVCPSAGKPCQPRCGDGKKVGSEACDDGNKMSGDGCNAGCKIEPGFKCPTQNIPCVESVCGDGVVDSGEGCDDQNAIAGDGCGPTSQKEPTVTVGPSPTVNVSCGDGLKTDDEDCDDGNTTSGDGCDDDCTTPEGWTCTSKLTRPSSLQMRVTYRDFKINGVAGGHPHFENVVADNKGIAGQPCTTANSATCGRLDANGKPVKAAGSFSTLPAGAGASTAEARFSTWFRDSNTLGFDVDPITSSLTLSQVGGATSDVYEYQSAAQFPINGDGHGNTCGNELTGGCCNAGGICLGRNYSFTTELRYFFQYRGGETLTFRGDDDVWVYINGRLAVDVGGVHCAQVGRVILGDADASCSLHGTDYTNNTPNGQFSAAACVTTGDPPACTLSGAEQTSTTDNRFGLVKGEVYEIVLFHAERHTTDSNFRLTLAGFLAPRSFCESECGDGIVVGDEFCDDGGANSNTVAGACKTDCTARNFCGDGIRQTGETCDNGVNTDLYKTGSSPVTVCAPGCKEPAFCGDGGLQAGFGEKCDNGAGNSDSSYGATSCKTNCTLGGYCGDGVKNGTEVCDNGANNGKTYGPDSCTYTCTAGPRCGDGAVAKGLEACDDGVNNGTPGSKCSDTCTIKPYCGDGIKQNNEECDYGQFASTEYGGCTDLCTFGPKCGDGGPGNTPDPEEECDYGAAANNGSYGGCTNKCALGPRCGDGTKNGPEQCDNGFNEDEYASVGDNACGIGCKNVPFCGDGTLQPNFELCDYGKPGDDAEHPEGNLDDPYGGCTKTCEFGRFCGDEVIDDDLDPATGEPVEACDDGKGNVGYRAKEGGCGYDCQPAPWCGDGMRNGPEQCDLGEGKNTGEYGGCNEDCTFAPRCGDKVKQGTEQCDDGPAGSMRCTPGCKLRSQVQ